MTLWWWLRSFRPRPGSPSRVRFRAHEFNTLERAMAERAAEAEQRSKEFELFFELSASGAEIVDSQTYRFLRVNSKFCEITGYTREELLQRTFLEITHPDDREREAKNYAEICASKRNWQIQKRFVRKDGSTIWAEVTGTMVWDKQGRACYSMATVQDVTERKRVEDQFRIITELSPQFVWISDHLGAVTYSNPSLKEFMGVSDPQILGHNWIETLHPDDRSRSLQTWSESVASGKPYEIEFRVRNRNGEYAQLLNRATPVRDPDSGRILRWLGLSLDITERKKVEEELRRTTELLTQLMQATDDVIYMKDCDSRMVYCNPATFRVLALSEQELYGKNDVEFLGPGKGGEEILKTDARIMASGKPEYVEETVIFADGVRRVYQSQKTPWRNHEGKIIGIVGLSRDITERKKIETTLHARTAELESLLTHTPIGLAFFDREHRYIRINRALAEMHGEMAHAHLGRSIREMVPEIAGPVDPMVDEVFQTGKMIKVELSGERPRSPGKTVYWLVGFYPIFNSEKRVDAVGAYVVDITERKKSELALEEAVRARDEFLSIASHELKTPLTSLRLQSQLFDRELQRGDGQACQPERVRKLSQLTDKQVGRLNRLVDDMLDISRIRSGHLTIIKEKVNLCELVQEIMGRMKGQFIEAGTPQPHLELGEASEGFFDRIRIEQVVTNLLTNAIRYGNRKPVIVKISGDHKHVRLSVRDHGIGISVEAQKRIFDRFERAIDVKEVSGLGLGLFIARQIIQAHGGRIWVESQLNHGSTFSIELPIDCSEVV